MNLSSRGLIALALVAGCRMTAIDMSGANYVGRGRASLDFRGAGASGTLPQDANWDGIRLNEIGRNGPWHLDFNDLAISEGVPPAAKAYVSIQLPARPAVGTFRAKVTCEIFKPDRSVGGDRIRSSTITRSAEVVLEKVELVRGGVLAGRISFADGDAYVRGRFDLHLDDPPPLFPVAH